MEETDVKETYLYGSIDTKQRLSYIYVEESYIYGGNRCKRDLLIRVN